MAFNEHLWTSSRADWETNPKLFDQLNNVFRFTLDVCATPNNTKVENFISPEQDGLQTAWHSWRRDPRRRCVAWMNPPYGDDVRHWTAKALQEYAVHGVDVVGLLAARPGTKWFRQSGLAMVVFLNGRQKFLLPCIYCGQSTDILRVPKNKQIREGLEAAFKWDKPPKSYPLCDECDPGTWGKRNVNTAPFDSMLGFWLWGSYDLRPLKKLGALWLLSNNWNTIDIWT